MHIIRKATDPHYGCMGSCHRPPPSSVRSNLSMRSACTCCCTMTCVSSRSWRRYPLVMKSRAVTMIAINASQLFADRETMSRWVGLLVMLPMITWLGCYSFGLSASVPSNSYPPSIHNDLQELSTIVRWQWLIPVIARGGHDTNTTLGSRRMRCKQSYVTEG